MSKKIQLSENAFKVAKARYFHNGEDWEACARRVALSVASIEKDKTFRDKFFEIIYNMDFIPGGRIIRNAGRPKGSMLNCFVLKIGDSIEEIGQFLKDALILWSEGGGVGCNFSPLRPKGDEILGKGGQSSGLVSFIEAADSVSKTIESGGQRRAAALGCVDVSHPEIIDFINAKLKDGRLSHFNISVLINEDFLKAVELDSQWTFKFKNKEYGKIQAREIWNLIIENMIKKAEPGLLNSTNLFKNNSYYFDPVVSTNPCVTGDTLIAVADGRGNIPIKQLAEEGKDVPVFSFNSVTKEVDVKMMRNPRLTKRNAKILKIELNDGSIFRCTENHKIIMKDGFEIEARKIKVGDRIHHMVKNFVSKNGLTLPISIYNGYPNKKGYCFEHRIISEFLLGRKLENNESVHHIDGNNQNNSLDNLKVMGHGDHTSHHQKGDNNVMKNKWWNKISEERKRIYSENMSKSISGNKNGNWSGYDEEELKQIATDFIISKKREITVKEWIDHCKEKGYPTSSSFCYGNKTIKEFLSEIISRLNNIIKFENYYQVNVYKKFLEIKKSTDLNVIFENNSIYVIKICEHCGKDFKTEWNNREKSFCGVTCYNKSNKAKTVHKNYYKNILNGNKERIARVYIELKDKLNRDPFLSELTRECRENNVSFNIMKDPDENHFSSFGEIQQYVENEYLNYKIISIQDDGFEDVYNGTVEDNHNFYIFTSSKTINENKRQENYILSCNCGEIPLANGESCCLGSLVLPNFITGTTNTNWQKLEKTIKLAVRFLDNVLDVNRYALQENDIKSHNSRRIGLGIMGLADYLFAKQIRYGSKEALSEIEKLMRFIRDTAYQASVELAVEKGTFPKFESVPYGNSSFVRKLPASLRLEIKEKGIRNCTILTAAPTGTTSLLPGVTSGIEPLIFKAYKRNDRVGERIYVHPKYKELLLTGNSIPDWFVDMRDLSPRDHFETQSIIQKYIDGAVSKTINLPKGIKAKELSKLLVEFLRDLKGATVYVDGSREGQIYNSLTDEEVRNYLLENKKETTDDMSEDDVKCTVCERNLDGTMSCQIKKEG